MKKIFGILCMVIGAVLMTLALSLFISNQKEDRRAAEAAQETLVTLVEQIEEQHEETVSGNLQLPQGNNGHSLQIQMSTMEVEGNTYVGFLSLPALGMELPIMADWNYELLQLAPCLYSGTTFTNDMVLMAHNFQSHFGRINELQLGDEIIFTDVTGGRLRYEVVAKDVLASTDVEEMIEGAYDLTLFTCTYGGKHRITVYCNQTDPQA